MSFISTPGDGRSAILKILNIIANKNYTLNDVIFSNPTPNADVTKNRNTKVTVTFKPEYGNYGTKEIFYNRIHITDLPVLTVARGSATTYHQLIPVLNSTFNLNLTASDLDNGPLPDVVSANVTITLPVANNSYLYYDSASINTVGFTPSYDIFKPSHTLLSYICEGFTRYGEYSDNDGGIYTKLLQTNSPDCGFEDGLPRIELTNPASMSVLEEANSGVFTLELVNPDTPVTVTLNGNGLTFSSNNIVLNSTTPTATFTVSSNNPGIFEIAVTNNAGVSNPFNRYFTIIDKYNTSYILNAVPELESFINQNSGLFTLQGLNVDPDEPIVVTINASGDLNPTVATVTLTSAQPSATFRVNSATDGVFFISFSNNRGLQDPDQVAYLVRPEVSLVLTPPTASIVDDQQSGLFTVTLVDGFEDVTITPVAPGSASIVPSSFILSPQEPSGSFRLTYNSVGTFDLDISNNGGIPNPGTYQVDVLPAPYITVTPPGANIYTGQVSGLFTVQLFNALEPVTVSITSNTDSISTTSIILNPQTPTATFTITEATEGSYVLGFTNNKGYSITTSLNVDVLRTLVPQILFEPPTSLDLEVGQVSGEFTISLIDHLGPVTVNINVTAGLTASETSVILDSNNDIATFTVTGQTTGTKTVSLTNNASIPNPGNSIFSVRLPDFVQLTTVPATIRQNTLTDNFLVTLQNPVVPVTVTPGTENGNFTPGSVLLSVAQPTATFRGTFTQEGPATVSLTTSPITPSTNPVDINVLEQVLPELTLSGPSGTFYPGDPTGNFTVTLINGQSSVTVSIVSETDSTSIFSAVLTPAQPSVTFTVTDSQAGVYNVSITNNAGLTNPAAVPVTITADPGSLQFTGPATLETDSGEVSGNFTVTGLNLVRSVVVTPATTGNRTFTPTSLTLTPGQPSGTFTLNSTDIGIKTVSLSNNRGYSNPASINYEFLTPTFPYLTLTGPGSSTVFVNDETGDFTITLNNPENPVNVNVVVIKNSVDVTAQVLADSTYALSSASPIATFKLLPQIDGVLEVSITNADSIQVPTTPINITATYNTVISIELLGSGVSATCFEDTTYVLSVIRNHSVGSTVVDLPVISGVTFQYSQITIGNGATSQPVNVTFNNVATYELYVLYAGATQSNTIDVTSIIKPTYSVTPTGPLSIQEDLAPTEFTVTGSNLAGPVTITVSSWGSSGINTTTVTITPADPIETFTIAPTVAGNYNLSFTNNSLLANQATISVAVLPKPTLLLSRTGSGNVTREQEVTFTATLQNGTADVEITPVTDVSAVVDGYVPPLILSPAEPTATFTVKLDIAGNYTVGITNTSGLDNPAAIPLTVINGSLILTVISTSLESGVESDNITVELQDYDLPTIVTINLSNFADGTLTIDPIDEYSSNQILLSSSNRIGIFTITKTSTGVVNLSLTNNKQLTNPTPVNIGFFDEPMYTVLSPLITTDLINQSIGPYTVTGQTLNIPITDKLHSDPHKASVVLFLDFYDPIGNVITDKSPLANTVSVFGNAQIDTFEPIYGDRSYLSAVTNGDYLTVPNIDNIFDFPGDFTIEFDIVKNASGEEILLERYHPSNNVSFIFGYTSSGYLFWNNFGSILNGTIPLTNGVLYKIAVSRIGSNLALFVNGKLDIQYTNTTDYTSNPSLVPVLGIFGRVNSRLTSSDFTGKCGKVKITKGVGRYSGNYTPESLNPKPNVSIFPYHDRLATDIHKNNTMLFLDFSGPVGNTFIDYSPINNKINPFAQATQTTASPIYGNTVGLFDGGGDYLTINENVSNFHFPGDFTIEIDFISALVSNRSLIDLYKLNITGYYHLWINSTGKLEWVTYDGSSIIKRESTLTLLANTLYKVAISRISGTFRMHVNGILQLEVVDTINYSPPIIDIPQLAIGAQVTVRNSSYDFQGRIGKVKITKGVGRYDSNNYTPETLAKLTFTPNVIELTVGAPSVPFSITSSASGTFVTKFNNFDNLPNPPDKTLTFEKLPSISLTPAGLNLIVGQPSDMLTLSLIDATVPVEITFNLPPELLFDTPPTDLVGNKVILSSTNQTVIFTLVSSTNGTFPFSITNNKQLTNPATINFNSLFLTTLTKTEPLKKTVFVKDKVIGYNLEVTGINEPIIVHTYVDNLIDDPYFENVSLLLDFNGEVNDTEIIDYSPRQKVLSYGVGFRLNTSFINTKELAMSDDLVNSYITINQANNVSTYNDFVFGTGDFTIEFELVLRTTDNNFYLLESRQNTSNGYYLYVTPAGILQWYSGGLLTVASTLAINDNVKHHVAISRVGGQLYILIDGIVNVSGAISSNYNHAAVCFAIGKLINAVSDAASFKGRMCSFKITKGIGRYSSNISNFGIKKLKATPFRRTFTANNQNQLFDLESSKQDDFILKAYSNKTTVLPTGTNLSFKKNSSFSLISPTSKVTNVGENSNEYRINLIDPSIPVKIFLNTPVNLVFATGPTNLSAVNEITLDSTNSSSTFTLTSSVEGSYDIIFTNDSGLVDLPNNTHSFITEGSDPLFINGNDLRLNLNKPDDTNHSLNIFQTLI